MILEESGPNAHTPPLGGGRATEVQMSQSAPTKFLLFEKVRVPRLIGEQSQYTWQRHRV